MSALLKVKQITTVAFFLFFVLECYSQRVGIGTVQFTPVSTLDVKGNLTIGSNYSGSISAPANGLLVEGNMGLGQSSFGISAAKTFAIGNGTAPATSPADAIQLWSSDRAGIAGKASLFLRTEDGTSHVFGDRVGIGVLTPANIFDVEGAAVIGASYSGTSTAPANGLLVEGYLGVGTSSPAARFQVQTSSNALNIVAGFRNENGTESGGNAVGFGFLNEGGGNWWKAAIVHERTSGYGCGTIHFLNDNTNDNSTVTLSDSRMSILKDGNVGIGTTVPVSKLHVAAGESDGIVIGFPNDNMGLNGGSYAIKFYGYRDVISNAISAKIAAERTNTCCGWLSQGTDLAFYTIDGLTTANSDNSVERMRIKDIGNVGINTSSPNAWLHVVHATSTDYTSVTESNRCGTFERSSCNADDVFTALNLMASKTSDMTDDFGVSLDFQIKDDANVRNTIASIAGERYGSVDNTGRLIFEVNNSGTMTRKMYLTATGLGVGITSPTQALDVSGNGKFTGTVTASCGVLSCSDIRYKKDIQPLKNSLDNILKLNSVSYKWRKSEFPSKNFSDNVQVGFIAQELEKIYPELVSTDDNGYKLIDYSRLSVFLVDAIKQQQELIQAQQMQIDNLNLLLKKIMNTNTN